MTTNPDIVGKFFHGFIDLYGYVPMEIYCSVTGKPLGSLDQYEFAQVVGQCADIEHLRFKVLASMRPGMKWLKMNHESLDSMRKNHPVETMAWLLNRLYTPAQTVSKPIPWDQMHEERIKLYDSLDAFRSQMSYVPNSAWDQVMLKLLELHAKFDLKNEIAPFTCQAILAFDLDSLMVELLVLLTPWYARRVQAYEDALDRAELMRTNPMARRAFLNTWLEQEPTQATVAREAKQKDLNTFGSILDEIMGNASHKPAAQRPSEDILTPAQPTGLASSKMPRKFGVK